MRLNKYRHAYLCNRIVFRGLFRGLYKAGLFGPACFLGILLFFCNLKTLEINTHPFFFLF